MLLPSEVADSVSPRNSVLLLIDMQRRHLDVDGVGYHTLPYEHAKSATRQASLALEAARQVEMPVVHIGTWNQPATPWGLVEGTNPFWQWQNGKVVPGADFVRQAGKCMVGSVWAEFMPEVAPASHEPVLVKKRYSSFYMTELDLVLNSFDVDTIFVGGVNTNNCCLHTMFDGHARDFRMILLEDACGSMNGEKYHDAAVAQIEAAIGWISNVDEFQSLLATRTVGSSS